MAEKIIYNAPPFAYDAFLAMRNDRDDIVICPMTEGDLDEVEEIEAESFPLPWSRSHFLDEMRSPLSFPMVAIDPEGRIAGYLCPMVVVDEGHILNVAVSSDCRGRGIGRLLVVKALKECREMGAEFVSLEVRPSNTVAIALYRRLGFVETGRRRGYYENGEDALLMEYIFKNSEEGPDAV